jgi:uncharacterized protein YjbJ (UPF0337 family)
MDEDILIGAAKQAAGRVERATGGLIGDSDTEVRGAARELGGATQRAFGEAKDEVRDTIASTPIPPLLTGVVLGLVIGLFLNRR